MSHMEEVKQRIHKEVLCLVESGIKKTELATWLVRKMYEGTLSPNQPTPEMMDVIDELIDEGEIIEIEYVLPHLDYRIKSFLVPKGTEINIKEGCTSEQTSD